MKTIIAGSRTVKKYAVIRDYLERFHLWNITEVVSGTCFGPDKFGECWAIHKKIHVVQFPAQWELHGKKAGPIRNRQMGEYADAAIVFWDGKSRGTKSMIDIMKDLGKPVEVVGA